MTVSEAEVRAAYDTARWSAGPERIYATLAALLLDECPEPLRDRRLLDVGAGTGVVSRVARSRGALPFAVDLSTAMLARAPSARVAASVRALPFRDAVFDAAAAAFVLNHLADPAAALRETARVVRPGGAVLASVFAAGDEHPAKDVVDRALYDLGWRRPEWYVALKDTITPMLGSPASLASVAREAGLRDVVTRVVTPPDDVTDAETIVDWRLGLAHVAPYVAALPDATALRERLVAEITALGQPLRPRVVVLSSRRA